MKNSMSCPDCMAMGGKCYAHGGEAENEKLAVSKERSNEAMQGRKDMMAKGNVQSNVAKMAKGGSVVDQIMEERKKMASGGLVDADAEPDYDTRMDFEPVHTREDEEHDTESSSLDDKSLIGQILHERKMRRRG